MNNNCLHPVAAIAVASAIVLAACHSTSNDNPVNNNTSALDTVSNLKAYAASGTSVGLAWNASPSEGSADFLDYEVTASPGSSTVSTSTRSAVVPGLTEGTLYTFAVIARAKPTSATFRNSLPVNIQWSPARRLTSEGSAELRLYESGSSAGHNALCFFYPGANGPKTISVQNPADDSLMADVFLNSEFDGSLSLLSASFKWPIGGRTTYFSNITIDAASLDTPQAAPPDTGTFLNTVVYATDGVGTLGKILLFRTASGNYGRMFLFSSGANSLVWGTAPDRYFKIALSYQSTVGNRFAKSY